MNKGRVNGMKYLFRSKAARTIFYWLTDMPWNNARGLGTNRGNPLPWGSEATAVETDDMNTCHLLMCCCYSLLSAMAKSSFNRFEAIAIRQVVCRLCKL